MVVTATIRAATSPCGACHLPQNKHSRFGLTVLVSTLAMFSDLMYIVRFLALSGHGFHSAVSGFVRAAHFYTHVECQFGFMQQALSRWIVSDSNHNPVSDETVA